MEIIQFQDCHLPDVVSLWNKACREGMPYKPFTEEGFKKKFLDNPHFSYEGTFVGVEDGRVIGFANGLYKKEFLPNETHENTPGYLTFVLVDSAYRRRGYGTRLLQRVEQFFKDAGKKEVQVIFFNPINLEWFIPNTDGHDHPNAPGVDTGGPGYPFLKKNGYRDRTRELSMHLDLAEFSLGERVLSKQKELEDKGITIEFYDPAKHSGFDELFDNLKHEHWRKDIKDNLSLEKPHLVLIVNHQGRIRGFAGPLALQPSGRAWFAGIGVDPAYEGQGIGTVLFFRLMQSFKEMGARFSSLFTGEENPARRMYERAGFQVVKTWAVMRKEL